MDLAWQVLDVQGAELQVLRGMEALLRGPALQTAVIEVSGTELYSGQALQAEVASANAGIFKAVPKIKIETLTTHVASATRTVACEILVHLNNKEKQILKVVLFIDVIVFEVCDEIIQFQYFLCHV